MVRTQDKNYRSGKWCPEHQGQEEAELGPEYLRQD